MKKFTFVILFFILLLIFFVDFVNHSSYRAVSIYDDCKIGIDFNQNNRISEDEIISLPNIRNFCSDEDLIENEKIFGTLTEQEKLYLKIISKKFYEKIFLNSIIRNDKGVITVNLQNAEALILKEGLAISKNNFSRKEIINIIAKHKEQANKKEIVLLNTKSLKYHKLNCKNGMNSKQKFFCFKNELPQKAKPCSYCYSSDKYEKIDKKPQRETPYEKTVSYGQIELFVEHGAGKLLPSEKCNTKMCKALKREIDNSKNTIDMAIYDLSDVPEIISSLENAKKRGVIIRAVSDDENNKNNTQTTTNLQKFSNQIFYDTTPQKDAFRLMHNKFFIFDKQKVWTGSANITKTGLSGFNANNAILITSEEIAKKYSIEFENFINNEFHSAKKSQHQETVIINDLSLSAYFSPQDKTITKFIIPEIKKAQKYIYIPVFIITDSQLANELANAKKRGVDVKLIIDATSARNKYSRHTILRQNNIPVKIENFAGKMHMKTVIIDDKFVFLGSMNLTKSGNIYNDENCIKIENNQFAKDMKTEFLSIWSKIPDKYLTTSPAPESPDSIGSCFDGIDNDFDGKTDAEDSGCRIFYKEK